MSKLHVYAIYPSIVHTPIISMSYCISIINIPTTVATYVSMNNNINNSLAIYIGRFCHADWGDIY